MRHATIDGWLYVLIALCTASSACLATDEAAKYIVPATLWYARSIAGILGAGFLALKMYRSTTFADAKAAANEPQPVPTIQLSNTPKP
jgi:hypothetical protein